MPVYSRKQLRQRLSQEYLNEVLISTTTGSHGPTGSIIIWDTKQADPTLSGHSEYQRAWVRAINTTQSYYDNRVSTFNTQTGAFIIVGTSTITIQSGSEYEIHNKLSPALIDRSIDAVVRDLRFVQELPLWSIENGHTYSLGSEIIDVLDARYFSDPTDSLSKGIGEFQHLKFRKTASGQELRVTPSLPASYQLVLDAVLLATLQGSGEAASVNIPTDEVVMAGAAARCYWMMEQDAPGQESTAYRARRKELAHMYGKLARRFAPTITRRVQLEEAY